jgi:solute carrier family 35 protein E1
VAEFFSVQSSSPIFSAVVSWYIFDKKASPFVYTSLLVIATGVTFSAITELQFDSVGFFAAVLAAFIGVLHSALMKRVMQHFAEVSAFQLHYHTTITAVVFMFPFAMFLEGNQFQTLFESDPNAKDDAPVFLAIMLLLGSIFFQYLQTIMSTLVLSSVTVISHQVSSTLKRLIVIVCSVWYFQNPVSISNAVGMLTALGGFFLYGLAMLQASISEVTTPETPPLRIRTGNTVCDTCCARLFPNRVYSLPVYTFESKNAHEL